MLDSQGVNSPVMLTGDQRSWLIVQGYLMLTLP